MAVAQQAEDIARLVVTGNLLVEAVDVISQRAALTINRICQARQVVVGEAVAFLGAVLSRLPRHAGDVPVEAGGVARDILLVAQRLAEQRAVDARYPGTQVVGVIRLQLRVPVAPLRNQTPTSVVPR